jgi:hypothetical protein
LYFDDNVARHRDVEDAGWNFVWVGDCEMNHIGSIEMTEAIRNFEEALCRL